jgi:hypothetical protein
MEISIVSITGKAAVIEYLDGGTAKRCVVPVGVLVNEDGVTTCDEFDVRAGIPYGIDWDSLLGGAIDFAGLIERIAEALRRNGVWTKADATPQKIYSALQEAYGVDVHTIIKLISNQG